MQETKSNLGLEDKYENKCPICNKHRIYKTKCGYKRAEKLKLPCRSCTNSIQRGGKGNLYLEHTKYCSECKNYKSYSKFLIYLTGVKKGKYHSKCNECRILFTKKYYKNYYRFERYGIDKDIYSKLLLSQNNRCKICEEILIKIHIDHCHKSGKVRGLLCETCNKGLGQFKDNIKTLENAVKYIKENNE